MQVLIVEDEDDLREVMAALLRYENFEVSTAKNGYAAVTAVENRRPDVILLDYDMPGMDGVETARRISGSPNGKDVRIVLYTATTPAEVDCPHCTVMIQKPSELVNIV